VPLVRDKRLKREVTRKKEEAIFKSLLPYFGDVPLCEIDKPKILDFAAKRVLVPVEVGRRKSIKRVRYIGHELKFLRYLLNRACDNGVIAAVPPIKSSQGPHRTGSIEPGKFAEMRKFMPRAPERYLIGLWETGWRFNEPRKLNWRKVTHDGKPLVDMENRVLRLNPEDVKEDYPRVTPITKGMMEILTELRDLPSKDGSVFVRDNGEPIISIRAMFNRARELAKIPGVIPHDLRRSTIRRWESMGVPRGAVMQATGHRSNTIHEQYAFLNEDELVQVFINAGLLATPKVVPIKKAGTQ